MFEDGELRKTVAAKGHPSAAGVYHALELEDPGQTRGELEAAWFGPEVPREAAFEAFVGEWITQSALLRSIRTFPDHQDAHYGTAEGPRLYRVGEDHHRKSSGAACRI